MEGRPVSLDVLYTRLGVAVAATRLEVQRTEFINTNPSPVLGAATIEPLNPSVFLPKQWVIGLFPCFRPPQTDITSLEQFAQSLGTDAVDLSGTPAASAGTIESGR